MNDRITLRGSTALGIAIIVLSQLNIITNQYVWIGLGFVLLGLTFVIAITHGNIGREEYEQKKREEGDSCGV